MKRCPKCSRTYPDENQKFCTFDGGLLLSEQPTPPFDPNLTVRTTSKELVFPQGATEASEAPTSTQLPDMSATIASLPATMVDVGAPTSTDLHLPPGATPLPEPPPAAPKRVDTGPVTAPRVMPSGSIAQPVGAEAAVAGKPPAAKKRSVLPWVLGILALLVVLGLGGATAGYFFFLKPWMAKNMRPITTRPETPSDENTNSNSNSSNSNSATNTNTSDSNTNANANTNAEAKPTPAPFNPPPGAVKFANSKANLDGKLAEHYVDFSFYYPKAWNKDPKAGVAGASNFARVEHLSDKSSDYPEETVAVGWYSSNGTFESDEPIFAERVKAFSDQISKSLPNFEQVSSGETRVNSLSAYEFRFQGVFKNAGKPDMPYWGRVIFLPPGDADQKSGVTLIMLVTSLSSDVRGTDDVGVKGDLPLILDSFRMGPSS